MRDLAFVAFLAALLAMGLRRPFLFVLAYAYVDIVSPQRLTYLLLNSVPISLIFAGLAVGGWLLADPKRGLHLSARQVLLLALLAWCAWTTGRADFPVEAAEKWSWVWKALAFAVFLPWTLTTRLRIEALALFIVLSAASIIIVGGIKTLASGGGYGELNLMATTNSGLYEGSILSTVAIAIVPLVLWLARHGTLFRPDPRVALFAAGLVFACLLIPVGTEARTGLVCIGVLALLMLRGVRRRGLALVAMVAAAGLVVPLLPASFTQRMDTIGGYRADSSAGTRLAVWRWTWDYVGEHPAGGGFDAYRGNKLRIEKTATTGGDGQTEVTRQVEYDQARAYHSAYFEMLGEQGWPGLILWAIIQIGGLWSTERLRRWRRDPERRWLGDLAGALFAGHVVYLFGALFVGIAFQPFVYMLIGLEIGLAGYARRLDAGVRAVFPGRREGRTEPRPPPLVRPAE